MIIHHENTPINILLVEDDKIDVMNVKRAFKKNKIDNPLYIAGDGLQALKMLEDGLISPSPKIVLLDINMPQMNGIEFLTEIRKNPKFRSLMVFVMTTSNEDSDKIDAYNLNVAGYILKPLSFNNFTEAIKKLSEFWTVVQFSD